MFFFPYIVARWHPLYVFALYSPFSFPWPGLCLSAVLAGLAPTQQRTSSSERGGLLGWGEGSQAWSHQSWQSFQSSGQFLQLGMRRLWIFSTLSCSDLGRKETPVLSTGVINPRQFCGKTPVYEVLSAMTLVKSVSDVIQCILFILNRCIVMSKMLSQNFPRIWTLQRACRFSLLESMPGACLPVLSVLGYQVNTHFPRTCVQILAQFKWLHHTLGVSSIMTSLVSARESGLVQSYFSTLGVNWSVLCCFSCTEVLWNDVIWGNNRPGRFVYVWLPSQP